MMSTLKDIEMNLKTEPSRYLCRICLSDISGAAISIFELHDKLSHSERIMLCTRVQICASDGLPEAMCGSCLVELDSADRFREKCENSDAVLKNTCFKYELAIVDEKNTEIIPEVNEGMSHLSSFTGELYCVDVSVKGESVSDCNVDSCHSVDEILATNGTKKKKVVKKGPKVKMKSGKAHTVLRGELVIPGAAGNDKKRGSKDIKGGRAAVLYCQLCNKSLKSQRGLLEHTRRLHSPEKMARQVQVIGYGKERMYQCPDCPYSSHNKNTLIRHVRTHTGEKPYKCDQCDASFSQCSRRNSHRKIHSDKTYYTCAECGKQFKYREVYLLHKIVHTKERKFICSVCNKGLISQKSLDVHLKRHYEIKNYTCESCGVRFVTRLELLNHSRLHGVREKIFKCNMCNYSSDTKRKLILHVRRHSGERPYKCDLCHYSSHTSYELKLHSRKHTKERNYACPHCAVRFKHGRNVRKHVLRIHGKEYELEERDNRKINI